MAALLLGPWFCQGAQAARLPEGFIETAVVSGINGATAMDFAPDGRLFLCEQTGTLRVVKNDVLLPGPFLTDRLRSGIEFEARRQNVSFDEMLTRRSASNPTGRVGDPEEFGDACAFLCAASSGFIVGQNLLLDGGAFNSTMG